MGSPVSLLKGARAFARDMPRDDMAEGYLWDVADYVPSVIDAQLTSRGAWVWASTVDGQDFSAGILASFTSGEQLLATTGANLWEISQTPPYAMVSRGPCPVGGQNPVQLFDQVIFFQKDGAHVPYYATPTGLAQSLPGAPAAKVGAVWKTYVIAGGEPGHEDTLRFSAPNDVTLPWDPNALIRTSGAITGLAALRSVIIVFHAGTVERIRGSTPPVPGLDTDLVLEPLFGQAGTTEPKSICYWNENVLFADEHGVQITDGAVLRNLCEQGSIATFWRQLYNQKINLAAAVFLNYYVVTVNRNDGIAVTLICDLSKRQWFRFTNVASTAMWASGGTTGMERLWTGIKGSGQLARLSASFFPTVSSAPVADANGVPVLPSFETPWYRLGDEGIKRVRFVYLSYDARTGTVGVASAAPSEWRQEFPADDEPRLEISPTMAGRVQGVLDMSYILSPQDATWTHAGLLPSTDRYSRFRLPVGKAPYGIAFKVAQLVPTTVTRISDIQVEAKSIEKSRV